MTERVQAMWAAEEIPPALRLDPALLTDWLTAFIRCEVTKVGFENVVLGLSGGLDSAVSYYLAARALGVARVHAVVLPYRSSSPASLADALACVRDLGGSHQVVDISPQIDAYFAAETTPPPADDQQGRLRRGNKLARERMTILYDQSMARRALVLGTSNKTELLLGYGTLFGDMASALNPLGDLYKTQVRQLAAHLGVPAAILDKPPTADLWAGQTDEDQIGYTYAAIDRALVELIDHGRTPAELVAQGFDAALLERLGRMIQTSQFKRCPPVIAKVGRCTVGVEWQYPRDWGA